MRADVDRYLISRLGKAFAYDEDSSAAVQALAAIGLLDDEEAQLWRAAFKSRVPPPAGPATPAEGLRDRVGSYLRERADAIAAQYETEISGAVVEPERNQLSAVIRAFESLGLIDAARRTELLSVLRPPWLARRYSGMSGPQRLGEVRRVFAGPPIRRRGLRVLSVELFDVAFAVRWHRLRYSGANPPPADELEPDAERADEGFRMFWATDDLEVRHPHSHGGSVAWEATSGDVVSLGVDIYYPALPPEGRHVHLKLDDFTFEVAVA